MARWLTLALLIGTPAHAGGGPTDTAEPVADAPTAVTVWQTDDGWVHGRMVVPHDPEQVRRALANGAHIAAMAPDILRARALPDGACEDIHLEARGIFSPFAIQTRRCPTAGGFREDLVTSTVFTAWSAAWQVQPHGEGTQVVYAIHTAIRLPVPEAMLRRRTAASVTSNLRAIAAELGR